MPRSRKITDDAGPRARAPAWTAARKHAVDLIPFLLMVALLAFIILDNARG